jgi:hypothetical protein
VNSRQVARLQLVWVVLGVIATFLTTSLYNFHTKWGWSYESKPPLWHVIADFVALLLFGALVAAMTTKALVHLRGRFPERKLDPGIVLGYSVAAVSLVSGASSFTMLNERTFETLGRGLDLILVPVILVAGLSCLRYSRSMKSDPQYREAWRTVLGGSRDEAP